MIATSLIAYFRWNHCNIYNIKFNAQLTISLGRDARLLPGEIRGSATARSAPRTTTSAPPGWLSTVVGR
jgi:hypothetical protein